MPCYQSPSLNGVPLQGAAGGGGYATEADCLQACKEGACCEGTTCSVKPACQCQGTGKVFKGVGTTCTPNPCLICGCPETFLVPQSVSIRYEIVAASVGTGIACSGDVLQAPSILRQLVDQMPDIVLPIARQSSVSLPLYYGQALTDRLLQGSGICNYVPGHLYYNLRIVMSCAGSQTAWGMMAARSDSDFVYDVYQMLPENQSHFCNNLCTNYAFQFRLAFGLQERHGAIGIPSTSCQSLSTVSVRLPAFDAEIHSAFVGGGCYNSLVGGYSCNPPFAANARPYVPLSVTEAYLHITPNYPNPLP